MRVYIIFLLWVCREGGWGSSWRGLDVGGDVFAVMRKTFFREDELEIFRVSVRYFGLVVFVFIFLVDSILGVASF